MAYSSSCPSACCCEVPPGYGERGFQFFPALVYSLQSLELPSFCPVADIELSADGRTFDVSGRNASGDVYLPLRRDDLQRRVFSPEDTVAYSPIRALLPVPASLSRGASLHLVRREEQCPSSPPLDIPRPRYRPQIELSSDQPPTVKGTPRARVFVACVRWWASNTSVRLRFLPLTLPRSRTKKIRCDGVKPMCHYCSRCPVGTAECDYDLAPRRRGPDRNPGARPPVSRTPEDTSATVRRPGPDRTPGGRRHVWRKLEGPSRSLRGVALSNVPEDGDVALPGSSSTSHLPSLLRDEARSRMYGGSGTLLSKAQHTDVATSRSQQWSFHQPSYID
ncbi:hypothetical protein DFH06DRAFT_1127596 [Mycena polygramma]|nr:hypothetical protein DFH06DRAFT_1127596 [Mycena polygramma]